LPCFEALEVWSDADVPPRIQPSVSPLVICPICTSKASKNQTIRSRTYRLIRFSQKLTLRASSTSLGSRRLRSRPRLEFAGSIDSLAAATSPFGLRLRRSAPPARSRPRSIYFAALSGAVVAGALIESSPMKPASPRKGALGLTGKRGRRTAKACDESARANSKNVTAIFITTICKGINRATTGDRRYFCGERN
jgi:hypothetical protein